MTLDKVSIDILEELNHIPVIDAHEHLPREEAAIKEPRDFYSLFQQYCQADLAAAGAAEEDLAVFSNRGLPLAERWERFRPFLSRIRTGGYARAVLIAIRDLLEAPDLNDDTYELISRKLQDINKAGVYDHVLRERCNIAAVIQCWRLDEPSYPDYFYHLASCHNLIDLVNRESLQYLARECKHEIHSLDDVLACMTCMVERWKAHPKVVGIKSAHAYYRSLGFQRVTRHDAEVVFNRMLTAVMRPQSPNVEPDEFVPLQDFLMFELLARTEACRLPIVFHTGLQAGNKNRIANANPLLLQPMLEKFPRARIDLFHGGMPWVREIAVLAKYFPGVHLNMAWMHIINPAQARSALSEWLDMVPNTKIFGFGGDEGTVENVYGHLKLARQNIAIVLGGKVNEGVLSRADAGLVARRLMFENPNEFYGLGLKT